MNYIPLMNLGWQCPKCGRVWSPSIISCWNCNQSLWLVSSSGTTLTQQEIDDAIEKHQAQEMKAGLKGLEQE